MPRTGRPTIVNQLEQTLGMRIPPTQGATLRRTINMLKADRTIELAPDGKSLIVKGTYRVGGNWGEFRITNRGRREKLA